LPFVLTLRLRLGSDRVVEVASTEDALMVDDVHTAGVALAKEADARRAELERERQVPPDLFRRAKDAGLIRQLICAELGGLGRSAVEWFRTGVEMARWEPSFSWVMTQGAGDHATYVAAGEPVFAALFLADPNGYSSSSVVGGGTLVPDGSEFRLDGRWGFCSGCQGATWVGGRAVLPLAPGQEAPDEVWALVPIEHARIEETWDVMGMIGTGSHTVVVEAQHIPAAWTFRHTRLGPRDYGPMSVAAGNSAWPIATSVAAVQLGTSRRALDAVADLVRAKAGKAGSALLIDNAHVQRLLMRAEAAWSAANAGVEQALIRMWQDAEQNRRLPIDTRIALLTANVHASAISSVRRSRPPARSSLPVCGIPAPSAAISASAGTSLNWRRGCGSGCWKTVSRSDTSGPAVGHRLLPVIPAQAGTQKEGGPCRRPLGSRLRGNDASYQVPEVVTYLSNNAPCESSSRK
jgi:indole-3-acetate monooxygenase